jgi:hypothetical protein
MNLALASPMDESWITQLLTQCGLPDEFKRVIKNGGSLVLVNMTKGERFGSGLYDFIFRLSPRSIGGCRGISLSERLMNHGFQIAAREYHQQLLFPSEVIVAHK